MREAMSDKTPDRRPTAAAVLDRLVENYPGPAFIVGQGIRVVEANEAARPLVLALRDGHDALIDLIERTRHGTEGRKIDMVIDRRRVFEISAVPFGAAVLVMAREGTEDYLRRSQLTEQIERLTDIVDCLPDFSFETDMDGRFTFCAPERIFGYAARELVGRFATEIIDVEWLSGRGDPFSSDVLLTDREVWLMAADGTSLRCLVSARPVRDDAGRRIGLRGIARDVTAAQSRETALMQALDRERLRGAVIDAMRGDGGPERAIRVAAEASMATLHAQGALVVGRDVAGRMVPVIGLGGIEAGLDDRLAAEVERIAAKGQVVGRVEVRSLGEQTALIAIAAEGSTAVGALVLIRNSRQHWQGAQAGILGAVADQLGLALGIRERVARLEEQSRVDALTGIMNRRAFQDDLPIKLRQADRLRRSGALLLIDLDAFKPLNDRFGHAGGDKALALLGTMFRERLRAGDLVARIGGDEFAFWLDGADSAGAFAKAGHLFDMMAEFDRRLDLPGADLGFSMGIALYEPGSRESIDALTMRADAALYRAKAGGRDRAEMAPSSGVG